MTRLGKGARDRAHRWETLDKTLKSKRGKMILTALKRGWSSNGNHKVQIDGTYDPYPSFMGHKILLDGAIVFRYYGTPILGVDLRRRRITNYGNGGYSISTDGNITSWESYVDVLFAYQLPKDNLHHHAWLPRRNSSDPLRDRFCAGVDWIEREGGETWFHWDRYDETLAETYHMSASFLRTNQNWRYFAYDWSDAGVWTRRFIDSAAERRWSAREAKRRRETRTKDGDIQTGV